MQGRLHIALSGRVGHDDDGNRLTFLASLLNDRRYADPMLSQHTGDLRQHSWTVHHHETKIIQRADFFHRSDSEGPALILLKRGCRHAAWGAGQEVARQIDDIADNRAARWQ